MIYLDLVVYIGNGWVMYTLVPFSSALTIYWKEAGVGVGW